MKFAVKSFQDELHVHGKFNFISGYFAVSVQPAGDLLLGRENLYLCKIWKVNGETQIVFNFMITLN